MADLLDLAIRFSTNKFSEVGKKNHFLRVLAVLKDEFKISDEEVLVATVLHDTLEDTNTTYEEIEKKFSKNIADIVREVSHPKGYNDEQKIEFYKKLQTISPKAKLLKLADFADNLRNIIKERKANPSSPYHNQYILRIREFLKSCPPSYEVETVFRLTQELGEFVTE